jgi:hypothetical protein
MDVYQEGYELKEDEYLLKVRDHEDDNPTGFMTKFNKDGSMPKAFLEWGRSWYDKDREPETIYLFKEEFKKGWKFVDFRIGKSQSWAEMVHPLGFTVEIYLEQIPELLLSYDLKKGGIIQGTFKWEGKRLIEQE